MIHLVKEKATSSQIQEMLERDESMIKIVVDIRRQVETIASEILGGVK